MHTLDANGALSLLGAAADMRCKDDVVEAAKVLSPLVQVVVEIVTVGGRFVGVYIESRTSNLARAHGLDEGRDVDDAPATGVDEVGAVLHAVELGSGDHAAGFWEIRNVEGDEVGLLEQSLKRRDLARGAQGH